MSPNRSIAASSEHSNGAPGQVPNRRVGTHASQAMDDKIVFNGRWGGKRVWDVDGAMYRQLSQVETNDQAPCATSDDYIASVFDENKIRLTRRNGSDGVLVLDVVVHDVGLVTEWVQRPDCVGSDVTITEAKGSYDPPDGAQWQLLVADLTGLPAVARIVETTALTARVWADPGGDAAARDAGSPAPQGTRSSPAGRTPRGAPRSRGRGTPRGP